MILLDTNVISEPLKPAPNQRVLDWIDAQHVETLYLATITLAELRYGLAVHPDGRKKRLVQEQLNSQIMPLFRGRILAFDEKAAEAFAQLRAAAARNGKAIGEIDGLIAATAQANGLSVATRDTAPFLAAGLDVINPWDRAG